MKRRLIRVSLVALNVMLLGIVVAIVVLNPSSASTVQPAAPATDTTTAQPVDQLASIKIALTVAHMTNVMESSAVYSQYTSEQIQSAIASTDTAVVNKPQVVSTALVSKKDIHTYVAQAGDTVSAIATKFSVSTNSVLWSNGLTGDTLAAGKTLYIPPVNGIVYVVKTGDTADKLASTYRSNEAKIIAMNDGENGLTPGDRIIIPDGQIVVQAVSYSYGSGFAWGSNAIYGFNGYDWGNCTWYVATQIAVPANWGNASTWAAGARAAGWHVGSTPTVGAIAQTPYAAGGLGHVAIVDGVSDDGSQVLIRDMNGIAGFDRVGVAWEPTSKYPNYITR